MSSSFIDSIKMPTPSLAKNVWVIVALLLSILLWSSAQAHGVADSDKAFLEQN